MPVTPLRQFLHLRFPSELPAQSPANRGDRARLRLTTDMTSICHLRTVLTVLHVLGAIFAVVVLGISAAAIAESNKATAAVNRDIATYSVRKLLATNTPVIHASTVYAPYYYYYYYNNGFSAFLGLSLFVAIVGFLLSSWLALCYLKPLVYDNTLGVLAAKSPAWARWPFYELVIACLWSVFWLTAAAAASDSPYGRVSSWCTGVASCGSISAMLAMSWLSWLTWLTILVLTAVEYGMATRQARKTDTATKSEQAAASEIKAGDINGAHVTQATQDSKPNDSGLQMVQAAHD